MRGTISLAALLAMLASGAAMAAPDEELLGKAEGYPVCPLDDANLGPDRCLVGLFSHFDEVYPARKVARAGPVHEWPFIFHQIGHGLD